MIRWCSRCEEDTQHEIRMLALHPSNRKRKVAVCQCSVAILDEAKDRPDIKEQQRSGEVEA